MKGKVASLCQILDVGGVLSGAEMPKAGDPYHRALQVLALGGESTPQHQYSCSLIAMPEA